MAAPQDRPDPRRIPDVPDPGGAAESIEALTLRIEMAELRVVRRDLEFQLHWDSLQQRSKAVMTPTRWLLPALGTGASWVFWRLVRGKRRRHERHDHHGRDDHGGRRAAHGRAGHDGHPLMDLLRGLVPAGAAAAASAHAAPHDRGHGRGADGAHERDGAASRPELGTLQLLTVLWGLMPTQIRGRVGPEITQLLLGVIAGFMQGRKRQREAVRRDGHEDAR